MTYSAAYLIGSKAAMNGEFTPIASEHGFKILTQEWRDLNDGYFNTFNPASSDRAMNDRSVARLNNMAG